MKLSLKAERAADSFVFPNGKSSPEANHPGKGTHFGIFLWEQTAHPALEMLGRADLRPGSPPLSQEPQTCRLS